MSKLPSDDFSQARKAALRLLARRARSVAEMEAKLAERSFSEEVICRTVERFKELGYLDDEAFARSLAGYLMESRPMARRRLAWELAKKGLDKRVVEDVLQEIWAERSELEVARAVARRRLAAYGGLEPAKAKRRLKGYLERRGFASSDIFTILGELLDD